MTPLSGRIVYFIFLLSSPSILLYGQTDSSKVVSYAIMESGAKSFQFHLINQVAVSYKFHLTEKTGFRFSFDLSGAFANSTRDGDNKTDNIVTQESNEKSKDDNEAFNLTFQYFYYPWQKGAANFFIGLGPKIFLNHLYSKNENEYNNLDPINPYHSTSEYSNSTYNWGFGLTGTAGIECFITKNISLLANYTISFNYSGGNEKYENNSFNNPKYYSSRDFTTWSVSLSNVVIGLGIYF